MASSCAALRISHTSRCSRTAINCVQVLIAGGMGMRPLMGFNQVGIEVLFGNGAQTVGEAVEALLNSGLPRFTTEFTCGGGGGAPQMGN